MSKPIVYFGEATFDGNERVDRENGVIHGVSVITSGVQARGHNLEVDQKTLDQIHECAAKMGKVPVKIDHKTGAANICGYLSNFHFDGDKLKADWKVLKSHSQFNHIMELAEEMPTCAGLSAAFMGKEEKKGLKQFARCTELIAVDLVANPAANPDGLFEAKVDAPQDGMSAPASAPTKELSIEEKLLAKLDAFETRFSALEEFNQKLLEFAESDEADEDASGEADEDVTDDEGDFADEPGDEAEEFSSPLEQALVYLDRKVRSQAKAEQDAAAEYAFETVNSKVQELIELNEQLAAENEALTLSLKEGQAKSFSGGQESRVRLFSAEGNLDPFEARVVELEQGGNSKTKAVQLAIKEDKGRYEQHLVRIGALSK